MPKGQQYYHVTLAGVAGPMLQAEPVAQQARLRVQLLAVPEPQAVVAAMPRLRLAVQAREPQVQLARQLPERARVAKSLAPVVAALMVALPLRAQVEAVRLGAMAATEQVAPVTVQAALMVSSQPMAQAAAAEVAGLTL